MTRALLAASSIALLAACGGGANEEAGDRATGFITPGASVPETAERGADGVPRDDYGRPSDYMSPGREVPALRCPFLRGPLFPPPQPGTARGPPPRRIAPRPGSGTVTLLPVGPRNSRDEESEPCQQLTTFRS